MSEIVAIYVKRAKRGPMDCASVAKLIEEAGMAGNADQGGTRQVTVLSIEAWDAMMAELGGTLEPSARRANVVVRGIDLQETRERVLQIGACRLRIKGETKPCEQMDEALPGLREAMKRDWRGGVYGQVIGGGEIRIGDRVEWVDE